MKNLYTFLAIVALCLTAASAAATARPALGAAEAHAATAPGGDIVGQCWKDGVLLYEENLGNSSDPNFAGRAQAFHDGCHRHGGASKFIEVGSPPPPPLPPPPAPPESGNQVVGQCWQNGALLYQENLGDSSDPGFPGRAQAFHEKCLRDGGASKFVPARFAAISIGDARVREPRGARIRKARFKVTLSEQSNRRVQVSYKTVPGTAKPGQDYRAVRGRLTFLPGETSKVLAVTILADRRREPIERFFVRISSPTGDTVSDGWGIGLILQPQEAGCECDTLTIEPGSHLKDGEILPDKHSVGMRSVGQPAAPNGKREVTYETEIGTTWDTLLVCKAGTGRCSVTVTASSKPGQWKINNVTAKAEIVVTTKAEDLKCTAPCGNPNGEYKKLTVRYRIKLTAVMPKGRDLKLTSVSGNFIAKLAREKPCPASWEQKFVYQRTDINRDHPGDDPDKKDTETAGLDADKDGKVNENDEKPWGDPSKKLITPKQ
jgi:hypothetical protein